MPNERDRPTNGSPFAPIERRRGCWNCRHWDNQRKAQSRWETLRLVNLNQARMLSQIDPLGEDCVTVKNGRRMVDTMDHAIAQGVFGICAVGKGEADFVHNAFLCEGWDGAAGSSLVTSGTAADKLPEELMADRESGES